MVSWWASAKSEGAITTSFFFFFFSFFRGGELSQPNRTGSPPLPAARVSSSTRRQEMMKNVYGSTAALDCVVRVDDELSGFQRFIVNYQIPCATFSGCMYGGPILSNWRENTTGVQRQTFNLILLLSKL